MNTRIREWTCVLAALALAAGIFGLVHRHNTLQVALDWHATNVLIDEIIDIHWQSLTDVQRAEYRVTWDSLKQAIGYHGVRAKQAGKAIRVRAHIDSPYGLPVRPAQVLYFEMSLNAHGNWTIGPLRSGWSYWFM